MHWNHTTLTTHRYHLHSLIEAADSSLCYTFSLCGREGERTELVRQENLSATYRLQDTATSRIKRRRNWKECEPANETPRSTITGDLRLSVYVSKDSPAKIQPDPIYISHPLTYHPNFSIQTPTSRPLPCNAEHVFRTTLPIPSGPEQTTPILPLPS